MHVELYFRVTGTPSQKPMTVWIFWDVWQPKLYGNRKLKNKFKSFAERKKPIDIGIVKKEKLFHTHAEGHNHPLLSYPSYTVNLCATDLTRSYPLTGSIVRKQPPAPWPRSWYRLCCEHNARGSLVCCRHYSVPSTVATSVHDPSVHPARRHRP